MESNPLVSIIIPSYNNAQWIGMAIESALSQDYSNFEVIICDNNSKDNSKEVIINYLKDKRVRFHYNESNIGSKANINKLIYELSQGKYIVYLSSDDYLINSEFVSQSVSYLEEESDIVYVKGKELDFYHDKKLLKKRKYSKYYTNKIVDGFQVFKDYCNGKVGLGWEACCLRKSILLKIPSSNFFYGDININLRLTAHGKVAFLDIPSYTFRIHSDNESSRYNTAKHFIDERLLLYKSIIEYMKHNLPEMTQDIELSRKSLIYSEIAFAIVKLLIGNKGEYTIYKNYVNYHEKEIYKKVIFYNLKYKIVKYIILPLLKISLTKKILLLFWGHRNLMKNIK
ncbi:hypothetical protein DR864_01090 [Runella rosea]|uniref:Glycosyltransferase 2-like domain-containing protein n=1 Tax=Runella rosea TaxID=2259595 RepID=A0A344TCP9_9BACT|nr:glycosyltransferase family 2 protein [Runella rosea]AXE16420.1 hypothetical protein DR864_01090 [Runella rosea]